MTMGFDVWTFWAVVFTFCLLMFLVSLARNSRR